MCFVFVEIDGATLNVGVCALEGLCLSPQSLVLGAEIILLEETLRFEVWYGIAHKQGHSLEMLGLTGPSGWESARDGQRRVSLGCGERQPREFERIQLLVEG